MKFVISSCTIFLIVFLCHSKGLYATEKIECYECKMGKIFQEYFDDIEKLDNCKDIIDQSTVTKVMGDRCYALVMRDIDNPDPHDVIRGAWSKGEQLPFEDFEDFILSGTNIVSYYCDEDLCNAEDRDINI